ncbi:hypothetical protein EVA_03485 [gut metagenome]|uniref:Uncharacterized protein n=1 Tax=gut metagenome TaxID=749906 RepID=J9D6M0_9ZZZZ
MMALAIDLPGSLAIATSPFTTDNNCTAGSDRDWP